MHERAILYGLPILCGLALAVVLLGPGAQRVVSGARVYGVAVQGATRLAVRVEVVDHYRGLLQQAAGDVAIELSAASAAAAGPSLGSWRGSTDPRGWADAVITLAAPLPPVATLRVMRAGRALAGGSLRLRPRLTVERSARCAAGPPGAITVTACVARGVVVPELPERIDVTVEVPLPPPIGGGGGVGGGPAADEGFPSLILDVTAPGGEVANRHGPEQRGCRGRCSARFWFDVVARAPAVPLDIVARAEAQAGEYHGELPLHPGGIWLHPDWRQQRALKLVAATPKERAYLSLLSEEGRVWGASVAMQSDDKGISSASLPLPDVPGIGVQALTLLVASDPNEPAPRVVAWPLSPEAMRVEPIRIALLLDGVPQAIVREKARMRAARWPVAAMILASAAAVLLLLLRRSERAREQLEAHLQSAGGAVAKRAARTPLGPAMVILATLALAFAILAAMAAWA